MPVVTVKARARIAAIFMAITPLQRCLKSFGWRDLVGDTKQTTAIAVKYPMKSAAIVISTITPRQFRKDAARTGEKLFPTSQQRLGDE